MGDIEPIHGFSWVFWGFFLIFFSNKNRLSAPYLPFTSCIYV